jgi:hypothetical protein
MIYNVKIIYYLCGMAKEKKPPLNIPTIFSLKKLSEISGVQYNHLNRANVGLYNTLTDNDRTKLFNALYKEMEIACAALGFTVDGKRIRKD